MRLEAGEIVGGRYRLERKIGAGGMGEVWAATQTITRKPVALKFLKGSSSGDLEVRRRLLREARAACAVRHPNVVEVHDVLEDDTGAPILVMELLRGESLEARLRRVGKLPIGEVASVMVRVVGAVAAAHALGIVHRDLKPENIFLADTAEGVEVKVLDFGIAKLTAHEGDLAQTGGLTGTGAILGTPYYMSPEQAFGEKKIDHRSDIWSLGIILYRALTGVLPTRAENIGQVLKIIMTSSIPPLGEVAPEVPDDVRALVGRMLSIDPNARPSDLAEVRATLAAHAGAIAAHVPDRAGAVDRELDRKLSALESASSRDRAHAMTPAPTRASSRWPVVAVLAAATLAGGAAAVVLRGHDKPASPSSPATSASSPIVATTTSSIASASDTASVAVAPSTSPSSSAVTAPSARAPLAGRLPPRATSNEPAVAPAATTTPAPAASTGSIGGVLVKPPF